MMGRRGRKLESGSWKLAHTFSLFSLIDSYMYTTAHCYRTSTVSCNARSWHGVSCLPRLVWDWDWNLDWNWDWNWDAITRFVFYSR